MKKIMSRAMVVVTVLCSMFLISACSWQKDVNIKTIEISEQTVPSIIRVGEFDEAGIELVITYEDNQTETITVTKELIPQEYWTCLETPGIYEIEIFFKGEKAILNVTIVEAATYLVEFYNGKQQLIERQFVKSGNDAVAPGERAYTMYGYEFIGWDRLFTNITEDIKVYGVYSKLTTEDMNNIIHTKMVDALTYMYSHDYVATAVGFEKYNIYHYDEQKDQGFLQMLGYSEGKVNQVTNASINEIVGFFYNSETQMWDKFESSLSGNDVAKKLTLMTSFDIDRRLLGDEAKWTYDYQLAENRNIYTAEVSYYYSEGVYDKVVFEFDDEKVLSCKETLMGMMSPNEENVHEFLIDYKTEEFVSLESVGIVTKQDIHQKMVDALTYMYSHDYVMTSNADSAQLNYHFSEDLQQGESQVVYYLEDKLDFVQISTKDKMVVYDFSETDQAWETYTDDLTDEGLSEEERSASVMFGGEVIRNFFLDETEYTYSYILDENRNIYTVEVSYITYNDMGDAAVIDKIQFVFDDEKILSFKWGQNESDEIFEYDMGMLVEYKTQEFETIEDQGLFLAIYNEARENVLAQTTLRYEEIEVGGGYCIVSNIQDNKLYEYTEYNEEFFRQTWVKQESEAWIEYTISESDNSSFGRKNDISNDFSSDNIIEYVIGNQCVVFDEETIAMVDRFECGFEYGCTKLTLTIEEDGYEMQMIYYIENGLITKIEEDIPGESPMTWIISYNPEDVEMVELPTDVEWTEM